MGYYLDLAKKAIEDIEKTKSFKSTKPSSRSELAAMLKRLECGECSAVRIYAHNLKAEVWFVRDDVIMEAEENFTLSELKKLSGCSTEHLKKVYLIKKEFKGKLV